MNNIIEDFKLYRDEYGLNQIETKDGMGCTTQNGTLFTVQYLICLFQNLGDTTEFWNEAYRVHQVMLSCMNGGLTVRYPNDKEFDSMDNVSAILSYSTLFEWEEIARRIRNHGLNVNCTGYDTTQQAEMNKKFYPLAKLLNFGSPKNYWNNNSPELFCFFGWYGRSPGFMGLIDICATGKTSLFRHCALLIGQFLGSNDDPSNTDARTMSYLIWQVLKDRSFAHEFLYKLWVKRLLKHYPNGMKDVYNTYYNRFGTNPNHPIVKYSKPY